MADSKIKLTEARSSNNKYRIHLYDNDDVWVAYEDAAYLLSFIINDDAVKLSLKTAYISKHCYSIAEITKKDFNRLVDPAWISLDEYHHKVLILHVPEEAFRTWMKDKGKELQKKSK